MAVAESSWLDLGKSALDWLNENEWAGDLSGYLIRRGLAGDAPEVDYEKLKQLLIQESVMNSPDQNTPTMSSRWVVDPKTGKRVQDVTYSAAIQPLFDMLVNHAGAKVDTYHAPSSLTGPVMGKYINDREQHMGLPQSDYEPWKPTDDWWSPGSGEPNPGNGSPAPGPADNGPDGSGPRGGGGGGGGINPNENTGDPTPTRTNPAGNQQGLIQDLIAGGYMPEGSTDYGAVNWEELFKSDRWLEIIEKYAGNKWIQRAVGAFAPNVKLGMQVAAGLSGRALNRRSGGRLSDFENTQWGSWDSPTPGNEGFSGNYWDKLLGPGAGAARDPNFGGKGMPGASGTPDETVDWFSRGPSGSPSAPFGNTVGGQGMGQGSPMGGLGSLGSANYDRLLNRLIRAGMTPEEAAKEVEIRRGQEAREGGSPGAGGGGGDRDVLTIPIIQGRGSPTGQVGVSDLPYGWRSANSANPTWKP